MGWPWHPGWRWSKSWHVMRGSAQLQMEHPHPWDTFLPAGAAQLPAARSINCNTFLKVSILQVKAAQIYHNHKLWLCGKLLCSHQGSGQGSWGMAAPTHWLEPLR